MSETLIPRHCLRFVKRTVHAPELGDGVGREIRMLQQRYTNLSGQEVWDDVPLVEDEEAGNG
jgi:hypothetical protein